MSCVKKKDFQQHDCSKARSSGAIMTPEWEKKRACGIEAINVSGCSSLCSSRKTGGTPARLRGGSRLVTTASLTFWYSHSTAGLASWYSETHSRMSVMRPFGGPKVREETGKRRTPPTSFECSHP